MAASVVLVIAGIVGGLFLTNDVGRHNTKASELLEPETVEALEPGEQPGA